MKIRFSSDGAHLLDRATGLNMLLDEVRFDQEHISKAPRQLSIAVTNKCNLQCQFCYVPKTQSEIPLKNLINWIEELEENGCLGIGFGGGEPTLYDGLPDACKYITQHTGMAVSFTTNCHELCSSLVDKLSGNINFIRVSMDGVGKVYEQIRGCSFDSFCKNLHMLKNVAPFGINCVINSQTIAYIDEIASFAENIGATELLLLPEHQSKTNSGIDQLTLCKLKEWINKFNSSLKLSISGDYRCDIPICNPLTNESSIEGFAHVTAESILKLSSFDSSGVKITPKGILHALSHLAS